MSILDFLKSAVFRLTAIILGTLLTLITVEILSRIFYQESWHTKLEKRQRYSEKYQYTIQ